MYSNVLRFTGKNYRVKIAKKTWRERFISKPCFKTAPCVREQFSFHHFSFLPTSIWIVSFIEMKVFRDLSDQVSSKTVDVSFVLIKLM